MVLSPRRRRGYHVRTKFVELFHWEIPKRELLRQFFSMSQEPHEMIAQFTIRVQDLYRQLVDDVSAHHIPDTFLSSLWQEYDSLRSNSATTEQSDYIQKTEMSREITQNVNVETQMWEKPRQPTYCTKSLWEEYKWGHKDNDLSCSLRRQQAVTMEATTSFSLTLSLYTITLTLTAQHYTTSTTNNAQQHT